MYANRSIFEEIKFQAQHGDIIMKLIFLNAGIFILFNLVNVILMLIYGRHEGAVLFNSLINWVMIPANIGELLTKPWTIITHMFAHVGLFHVLFNMLWLYWFGRILKEFIGTAKILPIYVLGALTGAFLFVLAYNVFPGLWGELYAARALGASAGVLAIGVAAATLVPEYTIHLLFFGAVRLKWIAAVLVVIDLVSIAGSNTGGHIAHLGGALFGFIFIKQLQQGKDWSLWFNNFTDWISGLFNPRKPRVVHRKQTMTDHQARAAQQKKEQDASRQKKLDNILDKISQSGYDSLTAEEKHFLFHVSKEK